MGQYRMFTKRAEAPKGPTKSRRIELAGHLRSLGLSPYGTSDVAASFTVENQQFEGRCFKVRAPRTATSVALLEQWVTQVPGVLAGTLREAGIPETFEVEVHYSDAIQASWEHPLPVIEVPFQYSLDGETEREGYAEVSLDEEEMTYDIGRLSDSDIDPDWPTSDVRDWMAENYPAYTEGPRHPMIAQASVEPKAAIQGRFITDFGEERNLTNEAGETVTLPRYGVWAEDASKGKPQVVDTSDDLAELMRNYNVKSDQIYDLYGNRVELRKAMKLQLKAVVNSPIEAILMEAMMKLKAALEPFASSALYGVDAIYQGQIQVRQNRSNPNFMEIKYPISQPPAGSQWGPSGMRTMVAINRKITEEAHKVAVELKTKLAAAGVQLEDISWDGGMIFMVADAFMQVPMNKTVKL